MMVLHPLTETHPVMSAEQYEAFKADIVSNGQLQPVLLYRDKIVDGRHRLKALKETGAKFIQTISLPNNLTLKQVMAKVVSTEKRRHQSPTQLAIRGYREYKAGSKQAEAVASTGCSLANLQHAVALEKLGRLDIIELLEKGGKVDIGPSGFSKFTDSLLGIVTWVKQQQKEAEDFMQRLAIEHVNIDSDKEQEPVDMNKINAIGMLVDSFNEREVRSLIAKLYSKLDGK